MASLLHFYYYFSGQAHVLLDLARQLNLVKPCHQNSLINKVYTYTASVLLYVYALIS